MKKDEEVVLRPEEDEERQMKLEKDGDRRTTRKPQKTGRGWRRTAREDWKRMEETKEG